MKNTAAFKKKLENELKTLEAELGEIAEKDARGNWVAIETEIDEIYADDNDVADNLESFDENRSLVPKLAAQHADVVLALEKIRKGTYGTCEVGGEAIDAARLEANPAAKTCLKHAKK
ncbi:MAG: TraR/DksA C4-type zinc finger protein [Patescibacteria group bacterium]|nr:TraR/DksA C4-type zinc finger protein [Patescibacteria group bacterium]MDE1945731.1 TraR/DksA C4-type zinc finger protein [Patescibacteria group bacterium]